MEQRRTIYDTLAATESVVGGDRCPSVPPDTVVFAIGDIHGCADSLIALHRGILRAATKIDADRRVVVYIGDYVDRGPDSRQVIDILLSDPLPAFETVFLSGNHESFMLAFIEGSGSAAPWLMNGGEATCRSYGIEVDGKRGGTLRDRALRKSLQATMPEGHMEFLRSLRFHYAEGDYLFVHAGIRPGVPLQAQDPQDLIWIREPFLGAEEDHGMIVVHGHTPSSEPVVMSNRIGIDTGACYGGQLTALVLVGDTQQIIQV